jgi:hypothetical protein
VLKWQSTKRAIWHSRTSTTATESSRFSEATRSCPAASIKYGNGKGDKDMARKADDTIMMRVSKQDKEEIRAAAESVGMSISAFMLVAAQIEVMRLQEVEKNEHK